MGRKSDHNSSESQGEGRASGNEASSGAGPPSPSIETIRRMRRRTLLMVLLLLGIVFLWRWGGEVDRDRPTVAYSTFITHLEEGRVERVLLRGDEVQAELSESVETEVLEAEEPVEYDRIRTFLPAVGDDRLMPLLEEQGVEIVTQPEADFNWWFLLLYALPVLLVLAFFLFFFRGMGQQGQQIMDIRKSHAKPYEKTARATVGFDDVAGQKAAKRELEELVTFLQEPERFEGLGAKVPGGFLLKGPPGTGKTLLARAVAGEAGVHFLHVTGSDFMEMLVGVGASRIRQLFEDAKKSSPSIIFIDELDSIGRKRGAGLGGSHDEREQTLNQLLSELDGFEPHEGVIVMAATNRPDILDPALLRPGRFDRQVMLDLPSQADREEILEIHAREKPLEKEVELGEVARGTPGFSGADLENLLNEAALLAARRGRDRISQEELDEARDKVMMGLRREGLALGEEERRILACHEAGHAVVAAVLPHTDPLHKVSIVPRGKALGGTHQLPEKDRYVHAREFLEDRLMVLMGGRAAEGLLMDTKTSGAEDDLRQASRLARKMVMSWGMSESFGQLAPQEGDGNVFLGEEIARRREYSDVTAREVDEEVRGMVARAHDRATELLEKHRKGLDALVEALLEEEEIRGDRVLELLGVEE